MVIDKAYFPGIYLNTYTFNTKKTKPNNCSI